MSKPVVLHLVRPYANADEYLEREAWSLDMRAMILIDEQGLAPETDIVFDVTLGDGSKPIRAEACVTGEVAPERGRPGGLRVRFKRYGSATHAFLERASQARWNSGEPPLSVTPPPASVRPRSAPPPSGRVEALAPPLGSTPPPARASQQAARSAASSLPAFEEERTMRFQRPGFAAGDSTPPRPLASRELDADRRNIPAVAPPPNRDDLLERLRQRAQAADGER